MENEFTSLVENALDFLKKSIRDLEAGEPKYSVIHFYSGLELFLKARLLREHWCLCASDVNKMAQTQFASGDFESIGLKEAKSRLANILNCKLSGPEEKVYKRLRERRNQAVHFYHPDDLGSEKKVAVEQLAGWHFLYRRLTNSWKDCFEPFQERLEALHRTISARAEYFPSIYAELKDDLLKQSKHCPITVCEICEQKSALMRGEVIKGVNRLECSVCSGETFALFLPCRECGKPASRSFERETTCQWCDHSHQGSVDESFEWAEKTHPAASACAWCGDCGYTVRQSLIEVGQSSLCLACHAFHETSGIERCEWCGDTVTGPVGDRISPGCVRCHYHIAFTEQGEEAPEYVYDRARRRANRALREGGFV
jgi:hypothetical protein